MPKSLIITAGQTGTKIGYVYGLYSSNAPELISYIGVSVNPKSRLVNHIYESKAYSDLNKSKWIRSEVSNGHRIGYTILLSCSIGEMYEKEVEIIKLYKSVGAKLLNENNGGKGGDVGEKGKIKIADTLKQKYANQEIKVWNKGVPMSEEQKVKVSNSKRGQGFKKIYSIDKQTGERVLHESVKAASDYTGMSREMVSHYARREFHKSKHNYKFEYYA